MVKKRGRHALDDTLQIQMLGGFAIRLGEREAAIGGRSKKLCLLLARLIYGLVA